MRVTIGAVLLLLLTSGVIAAAANSPLPNGADDERLHERHDVDHPITFNPHFADKAQWEKRSAEVREQILVATGLWPLPPKTPLNPVIHGKIDRDAYTIEKVFFASYPGHYVSGNLYRPKNKSGKLPAVLSPHGHWANGRFYECTEAEGRHQIELGAEQTMEGARYPLQARCAMLARMGCVVFHYDMVGYADSSAIEHRTGFTDTDAELRLQSFMGLQTWNSIRALDFLSSLEDVDPARIAVTGASGGGTQTMILCAIDPRPAVSFPAVMVSGNMQGGCICENASHLRVETNNIEIAALFAPKPLGMSSANDWTVDLETKGLPELKSIYKLYSAEDKVMARHFAFEHNYNQVSRELMYNWLNQHLKLGLASPVKEEPFIPVPPKELSVYDEQHPRPGDTASAATLRKYMTATSDVQLAELAKDPTEYRRVVSTALRVMVHDKLPAASEVVVGRFSGPALSDGTLVETGTLGRRGTKESVPYAALFPHEWDGRVVIWSSAHGTSDLLADGKPTELSRTILQRNSAIAACNLLKTGTTGNGTDVPPEGKYAGYNYAGYDFGYNPTLLAERTHDLLSLIAFARHWDRTREIHLAASGDAGPAGLLARALAGDAVHRATIDLGGFDFDQIHATTDVMMLPGALKYGGIYGFVRLCNTGQTHLYGTRKAGVFDLAASVPGVTLREDALKTEDLLP